MADIPAINAVIDTLIRSKNAPGSLSPEDEADALKVIADSLRPYKVYTAILNQSNTGNPVATVLENTIGDIVWQFADDGQFFASLTDGFPNLKTWVSASQGNGASDSQGNLWFFRATQDLIALQQWQLAGGSYVNNMHDVCVEIRVYP